MEYSLAREGKLGRFSRCLVVQPANAVLQVRMTFGFSSPRVVIFLDWANSGAPWWSHSLIGVDPINLINWIEWIRGRGAPRALSLT